MAQRCFAAKSARDVSIAGIVAAFILFVLAIIPVYFGMQARLLGVEDVSNSKFMEVVKLVTNKGIISCAASAVLLAIISTASSLLSAVSSNLSQDFVDKKKMSMKMTKAITLAVGVIALIGSYTANNILSCMVASYELSVACLFVPFVTAVFLKERCTLLLTPAILSMTFGALGFVVIKTIDLGAWGQLLPLFLSAQPMLIGLRQTRAQTQVM
jgi:SSS family solute:Na+ symporter